MPATGMLGEGALRGTPAWEVAELGNLLGHGLVLEWYRQPSEPRGSRKERIPPRTRRAEDAEQSKLSGERRGERQPGERGL